MTTPVNYIPLSLSYDATAILDLLPKVDVTGRMSDTSCTPMQLKRLNELLSLKGLVKSVLNFQMNPNSLGIPHNDLPLTVALILPLENGNGATMHWHRKKPLAEAVNTYRIQGPITSNVHCANINDLEVYDSISFNEPYLVKIDDWHSINNTSDTFSRVLSIRFPPRMTRSDLLGLFT